MNTTGTTFTNTQVVGRSLAAPVLARSLQRHESESVKKRGWMMAFSGAALVTLFLLAVSIAGWTVNTAYESVSLQKREQVALARQKELGEVLSSAQSLQAALDYAQKEGFVASDTIAVLDASQPVAQNVVVR